MAYREVFVEITKACWHAGKQHGVGSIVKMKENDANLCLGLGRAKLSDAKSEKFVSFGKKAEVHQPESKK